MSIKLREGKPMSEYVMRVDINETQHAFRINGVTFGKKHLRGIFPNWGASSQAFYRFLVIAPFLAENKDPDDTATEYGRYAVLKCRRIWEALGMKSEIVAPFMEMAGQMGEIHPSDFG